MMRYFKKTDTSDVFGYDEQERSQLPYIQAAIDADWEEITGAWPLPEPESEPVPEPTKEELLAQLQALTDKINALGE